MGSLVMENITEGHFRNREVRITNIISEGIGEIVAVILFDILLAAVIASTVDITSIRATKRGFCKVETVEGEAAVPVVICLLEVIAKSHNLEIKKVIKVIDINIVIVVYFVGQVSKKTIIGAVI